MYPIRLNLLSEVKKQKITRVIRFQFTKNLFASIFLATTLIATALLISQKVLEDHLAAMAESSSQVSRQFSSELSEIRNINIILREAQDIQQKYINNSSIFFDISQSIPPGVTISNIVIDNKEKKIKLLGLAKTREIFLELQNNLKENEHILSIDTPISDLTKKENISFNLNGILQ